MCDIRVVIGCGIVFTSSNEVNKSWCLQIWHVLYRIFCTFVSWPCWLLPAFPIFFLSCVLPIVSLIWSVIVKFYKAIVVHILWFCKNRVLRISLLKFFLWTSIFEFLKMSSVRNIVMICKIRIRNIPVYCTVRIAIFQ